MLTQIRLTVASLGLSVALTLFMGSTLFAQAAQPAAKPPETPAVQPFVRNWTRLEAWRFFDTRPGGGDPDYATFANRLQFGVEMRSRKVDGTVALQYVQFGGLPEASVGPGPLGTGALYYQHSGQTDSRQLYVRYLNARFKNVAPGLTVQVGRMGYTSGAEAVSGVPKIESVKRQRVDARVIGEFDWSIYQRGFDGVRADFDRPGWHASGLVARPTQGGFEDAAGLTISPIDVVAVAVDARPGTIMPRTAVQGFVYGYRDTRPIPGRADNSGRTAAAVDINIVTLGTTVAGAYPRRGGEVDVLLWLAGQTGSWYDQDHRAYSIAAEIGHQWTAAPWRPWLRTGILRASGDDDAGDDRHGTFFQMLPTVRKYSLSATYSQMNLVDLFAQALLRPIPSLGLRVDLHRVWLASDADFWYGGAGATQESGRIFGFAGRPSGGSTGLGTVVEGSADLTINRRWSVNGYVGSFGGGDVVRHLFAGDRLTFAFIENVVQF